MERADDGRARGRHHARGEGDAAAVGNDDARAHRLARQSEAVALPRCPRDGVDVEPGIGRRLAGADGATF
jgi:hypothetical protein